MEEGSHDNEATQDTQVNADSHADQVNNITQVDQVNVVIQVDPVNDVTQVDQVKLEERHSPSSEADEDGAFRSQDGGDGGAFHEGSSSMMALLGSSMSKKIDDLTDSLLRPSTETEPPSPKCPSRPPSSPWRSPFSSHRLLLQAFARGAPSSGATSSSTPSSSSPSSSSSEALLPPESRPLAFRTPESTLPTVDPRPCTLGQEACDLHHSDFNLRPTNHDRNPSQSQRRNSKNNQTNTSPCSAPFHLKFPSISTEGSVESDNRSPRTTFMYQDGSIVYNHDTPCRTHSSLPPSPQNFSYGPIPLVCKEEYLFDRLGLSEIEDLNTVYSVFMKSFKGYDVLPRSNKVIVLDTKLNVKKAFYALAYNSLRAATLWDSKTLRFVGMLTLTDFIRLLVRYHEEGLRTGLKQGNFAQLEEQSIEEWRRALNLDNRPLYFVNAEASLHEALSLLIENKVHRLPLIESDGGNLMHIITHKRLMRFLFLYIYELPSPSFMFQSIESLQIGTFNKIAMVKQDMLLLDALYLFLEKRVSAMPVVSKNGKLVDLYSRFDVLHLCRERIYQNLESMTIHEAIAARPAVFEDVVTCRKTESVAIVAERLARYQIHRLVVIDEDRHVVGMISLSDVLVFMVISPKELQSEID